MSPWPQAPACGPTSPQPIPHTHHPTPPHPTPTPPITPHTLYTHPAGAHQRVHFGQGLERGRSDGVRAAGPRDARGALPRCPTCPHHVRSAQQRPRQGHAGPVPRPSWPWGRSYPRIHPLLPTASTHSHPPKGLLLLDRLPPLTHVLGRLLLYYNVFYSPTPHACACAVLPRGRRHGAGGQRRGVHR